MPTKKGLTKYIETPEKLWELWCQYKDYCKDNPIRTVDYKGKDATYVEIPVERPRSIERFAEWCRDNGHIEDISDYIYNKKGMYNDYSHICTRIMQERSGQQIEYGLTGHYNANLTARLNQIADNQNVNLKGHIDKLFPSEDELDDAESENLK